MGKKFNLRANVNGYSLYDGPHDLKDLFNNSILGEINGSDIFYPTLPYLEWYSIIIHTLLWYSNRYCILCRVYIVIN